MLNVKSKIHRGTHPDLTLSIKAAMALKWRLGRSSYELLRV